MRNPVFIDSHGTNSLRPHWQGAEEFVDRLPNQESLSEILCQWWVDVACSQESAFSQETRQQIVQVFSERVTQLVASQPIALAATLRGILQGNIQIIAYSTESRAALIVVVDAIAQALSSGEPNRRTLDLAYDYLQHDFFLFERFENRLTTKIRCSSSLAANWAIFLRKNLVADCQDPAAKTGNAHDRDVAVKVVKRWQECEDPLFAIRPYYEGNVVRLLHHHHISRLLLSINVEEWLAAVDTMPIPPYIWGALTTPAVCEDGDMIRLLLEKAPLVYDSQGGWTRSVTAVILGSLIYKHGKSWHGRVAGMVQIGFSHLPLSEAAIKMTEVQDQLKQLENNELQQWMSESYGVLLRRPDGKLLALRLLAHQARLAIQGDSLEKPEAWRPSDCALTAFAQAFVDAGLLASTIRNSWREFIRQYPLPQEGDEQGTHKKMQREGFPAFVSAIRVLDIYVRQTYRDAAIAQNEVEVLWDWFEELLISQHSEVAETAWSKGFVHVLWSVSRLLWHHNRSTEAWEKIHNKLEPQRRSMANIHAPRHFRPWEPSDLLVAVGVGFLHYCLQDGYRGDSNHVKLREFLGKLFKAAYRRYLTAWQSDQRYKLAQRSVINCYVLMANFYAHEEGLGLATVLPLLEADDELTNLVYEALVQHGYQAVQLDQLFAEAALDTASSVARLQQWKELLPAR